MHIYFLLLRHIHSTKINNLNQVLLYRCYNLFFRLNFSILKAKKAKKAKKALDTH